MISVSKNILKSTTLLLFFALISSCDVYQVYTAQSDNVKLKDDNKFYFENDDLLINYNLWRKNGSMFFLVYNKSKKPIYLDLKSSSFIKNGEVFEYWLDVEKTTAISNSASNYNEKSKSRVYNDRYNSGTIDRTYGNVNTTTVTEATKVKARPDVQIPPSSWKQFYVYDIGQDYISQGRNTAKKSKVQELNFDKTNSPLSFRNYIGYSFDKDYKELKYIDNDFFVKKIEIMTDGDFKSQFESTKKEVINANKFYASRSDKPRTNLAYLEGCGGCLGLGFLNLVVRRR
jgi:hypothetical protein